MGRPKRESKPLARAEKRLAGLRSIDPSLDFGSGVSVATLATASEKLRVALAEYNNALSVADDKLNAVVSIEKEVNDLTERGLAGVAARYGKDSTEYEKAGGVRKSERKPPRRKKA